MGAAHLEILAVQLRHGQSIFTHVCCPVPRVDDVVVHYGQVPVEPVGFLLVLNEPLLPRAPLVRGCR